ncbi:hypothetical protein ABZ669_11160 [Streptomyces hirsutus]|uniref:hypothetical protein n=1 Tax=Streptomyces hirsutus TaxID=35620 RepID=UPI0033E15C9E
MNGTPPAMEPVPGRLCGGDITDKDYVGYFMNEYGGDPLRGGGGGHSVVPATGGTRPGSLAMPSAVVPMVTTSVALLIAVGLTGLGGLGRPVGAGSAVQGLSPAGCVTGEVVRVPGVFLVFLRVGHHAAQTAAGQTDCQPVPAALVPYDRGGLFRPVEG